MRKIWHIIWYEYTRHVFQKRFIWTVLSVPLMIIGMVALVVLIGLFMVNRSPIGMVDSSGMLDISRAEQMEGNFFEPIVPMYQYENLSEAALALDSEKIQAYFVFPQDFETTRTVNVYYRGKFGAEAGRQIDLFLRENLLNYETLPYQERFTEGTTFTLQAADGSREMRDTEWVNVLVPFVVGLIFIITTLTSGGYLLQAVVEEKENRTMEIMVTSVTPNQLMIGKIIGNISVGLTQLVSWAIFILIGLAIAARFVPFIAELEFSSQHLLLSLAMMLPAFVFIAAMMAALGATVTETREAQQVSGLFTLPIMLPYYFITAIIFNPNSPVSRFLSYFPLSAPVALSLRMAFTVIPLWEIGIIFLILVLFAAFTVWLAGRAFRIGMLSYGKRIKFAQLFRKEVQHV